MLATQISLQNVGYAYGATETAVVPALQNLTLTLPQGSFHWLTGPSGAGKTTLFRLLTLDLIPTMGSLTLHGTDVTTATRATRAALRRKIGVVYQDFRLLPHLTVRQNVELPLRIHSNGTLTEAQNHAVTDMLEWVGLTEIADSLAENISGGEQQRTAIARAVVRQPEILVADEPTGNVDAAMARRIMHLFTELHKHGTTVILATHDTSLIRRHPFPVIHLNHGYLTAETTLADENEDSSDA
jgi:cell division transport system ATP-binding protein